MNMLEYLQILLSLVGKALSLDREIFITASQYTGDLRFLLFWVVFIGGISVAAGQSVVLFANRVKPGRFVISLVLGGLVFVGRVAVILFVIWAMANLLGQKPWSLLSVARGIGLAAAPYWFGFLILAPYAGLIIEKLLRGYVFVVLVVALQAVFSIGFWGAILAALVALLVAELLLLLLGRLLTPLELRLNRLLLGEDELKNAREIYEYFAKHNQLVH